MENKDKVISLGSEQIDKKIEEVKKKYPYEENYKPKTNLRFSFDEDSDKAFNLRTIDDLGKLAKMTCFLNLISKEYESIQKQYDLVPFTWMGYSVEDWNDDIKYILCKLKQKTEINKLNKAKEQLVQMYSQSKKEENKINEILSSLSISIS